ncbi:hypothetical protein S7711_09685 [Stachybotrys chartarum IBT 7711]|uniref:ATP-dependent RNA helicase n=1 Tax=Stachybotrys chartarum (strain CBS 109288 / IBT 7711) TaxID=1280523 RepID=A0A084B1F1_STACB|nr:hypothetical protein S7711_09685 [Stachybotrys chartarum IBT 7711]
MLETIKVHADNFSGQSVTSEPRLIPQIGLLYASYSSQSLADRVSAETAFMDQSKKRRPDRGRRAKRQQTNGQRKFSTNPRQDDGTSRNDTPAVVQGDHEMADAPSREPVPVGASRFDDLTVVHRRLVQTITEDCGFEFMTPVQAATIHELLPPNQSDCLVQAKTGTGKTLGFLLPALQTLITRGPTGGANDPDPAISLLVISPTRELAMQTAKEATTVLGRFPQYKVRIAIGGTNKNTEERAILSGCHVLVATPGRLLDHMDNENIMYMFRNLNTLVLDEADRLLDMGFTKALKDIVGKLPDKKEVPRQGMLFSATIANHVYQAASLVLNPGYKFISTIPAGELNTHERVPQLLVKVDTFSNVAPAVVGCLNEEAKQEKDLKAIVFAPTAALAGFYGHVLSQLPGMPRVLTLHSRISQNKRTTITDEFRNARSSILVATDVIARGMDFPGVTTVLQVGLPSDKESYIHRLGRTARAGAEGRGIFIIAEAEAWFPRWTLKDITFVSHNADISSAEQVVNIATRMEDADKAKIYQAWLGYYKNHLKGLHWDNTELVAQGNQYARNGLGSPDTPGIAKSTIGKMGLRGTKGLVVVPDPPRVKHGRR